MPKTVIAKKSFDEQHKKCVNCHKNDNCNSCHLNRENQRFDHARNTGWALNKYHIKLSCAKCHVNQIPFEKLDNKCISCHQVWDNENFQHSVTGLNLNETHSDLSCENCHIENNYAVKPDCNGCHEGYNYLEQKPGKLVDK
jgi:hypothetical protein